MNDTRKTISKDIRTHWWLLAAGLAAIFCIELLALYGPQLIKQGIDMLAAGRADARRLIHLAGAIIALALGVAVLRALGRPLMLAFGRIVERDLRGLFFARITRLPRAAVDKQPAGDLMARATYDVDNIRLAAGYGFQAGFNSILTLILALAYMIHMNFFLTLLATVPMAAIPWLTRRQSIKFHQCHKNIQQSFADLTEESRDSLNAVRLIKVYDLMDIKNRQFGRKARAHLENNLELARVSALYLPVMTLVTHLSQAVVWGCGGAMAVLGALTPGDIVAFSAYLVMLKTPLVYSGYLINLYQRAKSSCRRIDGILEQPVEPAGSLEKPPDQGAGGKDIIVKNLTFSYPGEPRPVLKNLNLKITGGTTNALVGPVGSGKSTLLKLLTRIYEPPEGTIFLGGRDITRLPLGRLRSIVEMTPQEPFVFSGTIRDNLLLACPGADEPAIWQALADVGLAAEIRALPALLDTALGEKGHALSGGQKARLTLAGTLLRNRPVLLLDDPLSAVDTRAEANIVNNLSHLRNDRTTLIVSHRPLSLISSKTIFVLDKGCLTAWGAHADLSGESKLYQRLVLTQQLISNVRGPDGGS